MPPGPKDTATKMQVCVFLKGATYLLFQGVLFPYRPLNPYSWHAIEMTFDHISCDPVADRDHSAIQGASI